MRGINCYLLNTSNLPKASASWQLVRYNVSIISRSISMSPSTDVEVEYKITLVALVYAVFKVAGDYLGIVEGHPFYEMVLHGCRAIFILAHLWFYLGYRRARERINSADSISALNKLQQRKSIKYTLRWIYLRALAVGGLHLYLFPGAESLPLLVGTPILAFILMKENPEWRWR